MYAALFITVSVVPPLDSAGQVVIMTSACAATPNTTLSATSTVAVTTVLPPSADANESVKVPMPPAAACPDIAGREDSSR